MIIHCFLHRACGVRDPWVGHHASSHFFPVSLILTPTPPVVLVAETCHPFLSGSPDPSWFSLCFFITLNGSFFLPTGWVGYWMPCTHKGYFLTCSCNSQEAENSRKTHELERVSYSTEMGSSLATQGRAPRVRVPREEAIQTVNDVQTEAMWAGLHGGG